MEDYGSNSDGVKLFFPTGPIDNLDQTVIVSFAKPMVPLTTLDSQAECPLLISPSADGSCRWISTQTVEFTPKKWSPATEYIVNVVWTEENYTWSFSTPLLQRSVSSNETLRDGIVLMFNFPIKDNQLEKYLVVTNQNNSKEIPVIIVWDQELSAYVLQPQSWIWDYLTDYKFSLTSSLETQEGNLPTTLDDIFFKTPDAITNVDIKKIVYYSGQKWFESYRYSDEENNYYQMQWDEYRSFDTIYNTPASSKYLLPIENVVFDIYFEEPITDLSTKNIRLVKNGVSVAAEFSHVPEIIYNYDTNTQKEVVTKKIVRLMPKEKLVWDSAYEIVYMPDWKTTVSSRAYRTPVSLQVTRVEMIDYSKVCLYTNNVLDPATIDGYTSAQSLITTTPTARIQSIARSEYYLSQDSREAFLQVTEDTLEKFIKDNWFCPRPKSDEVLSIINTRLNPWTSYTLTFDVKDIYGNELPSFTKNFVTWKVKDKDKFLYIGYPNKNTIPNNVPLVVNVQSINAATANISVCAMGVETYLKSKSINPVYDMDGNEIPSWLNCDKVFTKDISLKNTDWLLSNTRIDLEKDIWWTDILYPIVRVVGSLGETNVLKTRWFSSFFFRSNLSLMVESAANKKLLFATDFNGKPIPSLSIQWYNLKDGSYVPVALSAVYNNKQWVYELDTVPEVLVASSSKYRAILEQSSDTAQDYDFGYIAWQSSAQKDFLYLYTDRPIYKPWDTVYYKGILRTFDFTGFKKSKNTVWTVVVTNDFWQEVIKVPVTIDKNSNFDWSFAIPDDMGLGSYSLVLQLKEQWSIYTNTNFSVEEYKKPVFRIDVSSGNDAIIAWDLIAISINPMYYFWGKIINAQWNYQILSQKYFFDAKWYSDFQFGEGNDYISCIYWDDCQYADTPIASDDSSFTINSLGNYTLSYPTDTTTAEKLYSFIFQVQDPTTKNPVSKVVTKLIHSTDGYVWIKLPYRNTQQQWIALQAIALDRNAMPIPDASVTITLIKQEWKAIKKQGIDWVFYYDYSLEQVEEYSDTIQSDNKWLIEKSLNPKSNGEYLVKVSYKWKEGIPFVSSQTVYVSGDDPILWRTENNSITKVIAEKTMVDVWDTAYYVVQSPINTGMIFVAVEKDDGILSYFTLPLESYATKFSLKIDKEHYPNIYLRVFLIGKQEGNPLPIYKRWLAISKINTLPQKLKVTIVTDKELYLPWDTPKITVKVVDNDNSPVAWANVSVSIVDQSLLALKWNPIKNPFAYFYDMKRYLWTSTLLSLTTLVDKLEIKDTSDGSKWWDGWSLKWWNSRKKRGIFKDTAYRNANVSTNAQWQAIIDADPLPDNLTTWVVESLVNTTDTKVGIATDEIQTALPLMINPNLPNMLSINDTVIFHPVIFNRTDMEQTVSFALSGTYLQIKEPIRKFTIPAYWEVALDIEAVVASESILYTQKWASKITLSATTLNKDIRDEVEIYVPIIQNITTETVTTVWNISGGKAEEEFDLPKDLQWYFSLVYSKSLFGSLLDGVSWPLQSSYDSLEQRMSSFMSHVYIKKLFISASKSDLYNFDKIFIPQWIDQFDWYKDIPLSDYIKSQLVSVKKFQNNDGWFVFRHDTVFPQESSVRLTNYIVSSLAWLRDVGYVVDDTISKNAIAYLKKQFYDEQKRCIQTESSCLQWALQGMDTISAIFSFSPSDTSIPKMWELIDPYLNDDQWLSFLLKKSLLLWKLWKKKEAKTILSAILKNQLVMEPKTAHIGKNAYYGNVLDTAYFLESSSYVPDMIKENWVIYEWLQRWIAEQKKNGMWWSAQDTISVVRSLSRFVTVNPIPEKTMTIDTIIGSTKLWSVTLAKDDPFGIKKLNVDLSKVSHKSLIEMTSSNITAPYYDLTMTYFLAAKNVPARDEWFVVQKKYYNYEEYTDIARKKSLERSAYVQQKISYNSLKYPKPITEYLTEQKEFSVGDVVIAYITFVTSEPREQVAIDHYIPAGSELVNTNLSTESTYANWLLADDSQQFSSTNAQMLYCDREEFRREKYFCYKENLSPGSYSIVSLVRITHAGIFGVRPTMVFEFYHPENFGRTAGKQFTVSK